MHCRPDQPLCLYVWSSLHHLDFSAVCMPYVIGLSDELALLALGYMANIVVAVPHFA